MILKSYGGVSPSYQDQAYTTSRAAFFRPASTNHSCNASSSQQQHSAACREVQIVQCDECCDDGEDDLKQDVEDDVEDEEADVAEDDEEPR
eukprot:895276-Pleurochrysis_carterae.AAC.1